MSRVRHQRSDDEFADPWDERLRAELAAVEPPPGARTRLAAALGDASNRSATRNRRGFLVAAAAAGAAVVAATWPRAKRWSLDELLDLAKEAVPLLDQLDADWNESGQSNAEFPSGALAVASRETATLSTNHGSAAVYRLEMPSDLRVLARAAVVAVSGVGVHLPALPPTTPQKRSGAYLASAWSSDQHAYVLVLIGPTQAYERLIRPAGDRMS